MIVSYKKHFWLVLLFAIGLTGLGFALDNDPGYIKASTTFLEFIIISTALFILISLIYFFTLYIKKQ